LPEEEQKFAASQISLALQDGQANEVHASKDIGPTKDVDEIFLAKHQASNIKSLHVYSVSAARSKQTFAQLLKTDPVCHSFAKQCLQLEKREIQESLQGTKRTKLSAQAS